MQLYSALRRNIINAHSICRRYFLNGAMLRFIVLFASLLTLNYNSVAQTLRFPGSSKAQVAYMVKDLNTGRVISSKDVDNLMSPASIMKCITAAALLSDPTISPDWTSNTEILATGDIVADTLLLGDILVRSCGDPTFATPGLCSADVVDSVAVKINRLCIRAIAGGVEIDSIAMFDSGAIPSWEAEDLKWAYGAGLYPFNYRDNRHSGDRSMDAPEDFFAADLETRLARDSIPMYWDGFDFEPRCNQVLFTNQSPPLLDILHEMMVSSNNLYAEAMLRRLLPGESRKDAIGREREILQEMINFPGNIKIYDGSGLTRNNAVTASFMSDILCGMAAGEHAEEYVALFPKAGEEGTVKRLLANSPLKGKLALKSGSMRGVQCYAGYKLDSSGKPTHSVVIMINNFTGKRAAVVKGIESYLELIFKS